MLGRPSSETCSTCADPCRPNWLSKSRASSLLFLSLTQEERHEVFESAFDGGIAGGFSLKAWRYV